MPLRYILAAGAILGAVSATLAQTNPDMHQQHMRQMQEQQAAAQAIKDGRQLVTYPPEMRMHTLANMRDHLLALQEIQGALAREDYDQAAGIAEQRLGMSSLKLHGAHDVAPFMPAGMQAIGTEMHRAASRFATDAITASASGDLKPALGALARVTQQCVACHASYRMQ